MGGGRVLKHPVLAGDMVSFTEVSFVSARDGGGGASFKLPCNNWG